MTDQTRESILTTMETAEEKPVMNIEIKEVGSDDRNNRETDLTANGVMTSEATDALVDTLIHSVAKDMAEFIINAIDGMPVDGRQAARSQDMGFLNELEIKAMLDAMSGAEKSSEMPISDDEVDDQTNSTDDAEIGMQERQLPDDAWDEENEYWFQTTAITVGLVFGKLCQALEPPANQTTIIDCWMLYLKWNGRFFMEPILYPLLDESDGSWTPNAIRVEVDEKFMKQFPPECACELPYSAFWEVADHLCDVKECSLESEDDLASFVKEVQAMNLEGAIYSITHSRQTYNLHLSDTFGAMLSKKDVHQLNLATLLFNALEEFALVTVAPVAELCMKTCFNREPFGHILKLSLGEALGEIELWPAIYYKENDGGPGRAEAWAMPDGMWEYRYQSDHKGLSCTGIELTQELSDGRSILFYVYGATDEIGFRIVNPD